MYVNLEYKRKNKKSLQKTMESYGEKHKERRKLKKEDKWKYNPFGNYLQL